MSQFAAAMGPILLLQTLPLAPMFYTGIVAGLDTLTKPLRRRS